MAIVTGIASAIMALVFFAMIVLFGYIIKGLDKNLGWAVWFVTIIPTVVWLIVSLIHREKGNKPNPYTPIKLIVAGLPFVIVILTKEYGWFTPMMVFAIMGVSLTHAGEEYLEDRFGLDDIQTAGTSVCTAITALIGYAIDGTVGGFIGAGAGAFFFGTMCSLATDIGRKINEAEKKKEEERKKAEEARKKAAAKKPANPTSPTPAPNSPAPVTPAPTRRGP